MPDRQHTRSHTHIEVLDPALTIMPREAYLVLDGRCIIGQVDALQVILGTLGHLAGAVLCGMGGSQWREHGAVLSAGDWPSSACSALVFTLSPLACPVPKGPAVLFQALRLPAFLALSAMPHGPLPAANNATAHAEDYATSSH